MGAQCCTRCNSWSMLAIDVLTVQAKNVPKQATGTAQKLLRSRSIESAFMGVG